MSEIVSETLREVTPRLEGGSYSILETLREGRLYLAEKAGKRFVLKTPASGDARSLELLKREYELSVGLSHPSLAYVFTYEDDTPVGPCLVQEYIDGRPLDRYLAEHPSARERRRLFDELLSAVGYLHQKGVIHNDLKPENILISRADDRLKLIDLGFADSGVHLAHSLGGTRGYASPELLAGEAVDARSDIYSLGVLLRTCFPHRYGCIVRRCLRKDPKQRYASADALGRALRRRGRLSLWVVLGLAVLLLGAFAHSYLSMRADLRESRARWEGLREAEAAQRSALEEAKAAIDAWYGSEIPAFREAMQAAVSRKELDEAWTGLVDRMFVINYDIPDSAPEAVRPAVRDYLLERYNAVFPDLQLEMIARSGELQ